MPNEGKSVEQIEKEFRNKFNIAYVHDRGWAFLREEVVEFYRSAISAVVLGAAEKAYPLEIELSKEVNHSMRRQGEIDGCDAYRSALTAYAQEIAKDV